MSVDPRKRSQMNDAIDNISAVYETIRAVKGEQYAMLVRKMVSLATAYDLLKQHHPPPVCAGIITDLSELIYTHAKLVNINLSSEEARGEFARNVKSVRSAAR